MDINIDTIKEREGISIRVYNVCIYNNLSSLREIAKYYLKNKNFLRLKNCGGKSNLELIRISESFISDKNNFFLLNENDIINFENIHETAVNEELVNENTLNSLSISQKIVINNLITAEFNSLSKITAAQINRILKYDLSISNIFNQFFINNIETNKKFKLYSSKQGFYDFIKKIKEILELVTLFKDSKEISIEIFNTFLVKEFSLDQQFLSNLWSNYNISDGIPIFKTLKLLIYIDKIFTNNEKLIFFLSFNYFIDGKTLNITDISNKIKLSKERVRQLQKSVYKRIDNEFSFINGIEVEALNLYGIDFTNDIVLIDKYIVNKINSTEGTNFNVNFINKVFSLLYKNKFTLIGDDRSITLNRNFNSIHTWENTYLIKSEFTLDFDFEKMVDNVSDKLAGKNTDDLVLHFQSFLLSFFNNDCFTSIDKISEICECILFKEFELKIEFIDNNIIIKRNSQKQIIDYVYALLKEKNKPQTVYELFDELEKREPGITKSSETLRSACQRDSNLIFFGRSSTYGLKKWEKELNLKGGTIRDIVEEYLKNENTPKHIIEITEYVNMYRDTNERNILTNIKLANSNKFIFYNQSFIGLEEKKNNEDYLPYLNIPKFLGKTIKSEVKNKKNVDIQKFSKKLSSEISIPEFHTEMIIKNLVQNKYLNLENNYITLKK